jgi:hypothetical protein
VNLYFTNIAFFIITKKIYKKIKKIHFSARDSVFYSDGEEEEEEEDEEEGYGSEPEIYV